MPSEVVLHPASIGAGELLFSRAPMMKQIPSGLRLAGIEEQEGGMTGKKADRTRCGWAKLSNPLYLKYHDEEWGVPLHDERRLFEMLVLEGAQAGLSWETILNKRENFRRAFDGFQPEKVARYGARRIHKLLGDAGIVRNRLKIRAAVANARAFLAVQQEFGSFDRYIWSLAGGKSIENHWKTLKQVPAKTPASDAMSKDLKRRGFKFVGSTICYAFMQAVGMVNDHITECFRHRQVSASRSRSRSGRRVKLQGRTIFREAITS